MKPAPFRYVAARSIEQALALKAEHGDEARFLAGGQSLVPTMNFRLTQPAMLIDINPLTELAGIKNGGADRVRIGALTRYRTLERDPAIARKLPLSTRRCRISRIRKSAIAAPSAAILRMPTRPRKCRLSC